MRNTWHIILSTVAVSLLVYFSACTRDTADAEEETSVPVYIHVVQAGSIDHSIRYMGTVSAEREVRIFSRIPDKIVEIRADRGDIVSEGDILAVIDNRVLRESVEQAEAALRIARSNLSNIEREYIRMRRLFEEEAISKQQFDQIETQYQNATSSVEQAHAALTQARENYGNSYIRAPFDGIISERFLEVGDLASGVTPVFRIIQTENVKVKINVVDREYNYIHPGQRVRLRVRAHPDNTFIGTVVKRSPAFDPISRLAQVEMLFPNREGSLLPGMFGEVELIIDSKEDVPIIPLQAILYRMDLDQSRGRLLDEQLVRQPYVYVIEGGHAIRRDIEIGYQSLEGAEVTSGLEVGEHIVLRGQNNLTHGSRVTIANQVELSFGGDER